MDYLKAEIQLFKLPACIFVPSKEFLDMVMHFESGSFLPHFPQRDIGRKGFLDIGVDSVLHLLWCHLVEIFPVLVS